MGSYKNQIRTDNLSIQHLRVVSCRYLVRTQVGETHYELIIFKEKFNCRSNVGYIENHLIKSG